MEHIILTQLRAAELGVALLGQLVEGLDQEVAENRLAPHVAASAGASVQAAIALVEAWANGPAGEQEPTEPAEPDDGICRHPAARRKPIPTMGRPHTWMCLDCAFEYQGEPDNG